MSPASPPTAPHPRAAPFDEPLRPLRWIGDADGVLELLDQTRLPAEERWITCSGIDEVHAAIRRLSVRGAPAIGIAAAYGVVLGIGRGWSPESPLRPETSSWPARVEEVCDDLATSRPTAVNLFRALDRMRALARAIAHDPLAAAKARLLSEAHAIRDEDATSCHAIGEIGSSLIADGAGVLTHCNAGALATAEYGTALAPLYTAHRLGRRFRVYADETRPLLQGARLTAWELSRAGIDVTLNCDAAAAQLMRSGRIQLVIVGADRIAANGDTANKIGTYGLAVLARVHGIPFYVAAPTSTFDLTIADGSRIPIEQRHAEEVREFQGVPVAPADLPCENPAFDVTPAEYITAILTERGTIAPVNAAEIARIVQPRRPRS